VTTETQLVTHTDFVAVPTRDYEAAATMCSGRQMRSVFARTTVLSSPAHS
jgi:hypothetical protein